MAGCPGAWHGERETGESRHTCHTPKSQNTEILRQSGVGDFPMKCQDAAAVLQHFRAQNMELFRSHGGALESDRTNVIF